MEQERGYQRMDDLDYREPTQQGDASSPVATPTAQHQSDVMLKVAAPSGSERTLDIAAEHGRATAAFAPRVAEIIAIDQDAAAEQQVRQATQGMGNVYFEQADAKDLPFEDGSFDLVICHRPLHKFGEDLLAVLHEVRRVLKSPTGHFVAFDVVRAGGGDSSELRGAEQQGQVMVSATGDASHGQVSLPGVIGGGESIGGGANVASASSTPQVDASIESLVANYNAGQLKVLFADAMLMPISQEQLSREGHLEDSLPDVLAAVFVTKPQGLPYQQSSSNQ